MQTNQNSKQLAQSASALGAGILGFGLGAKWGLPVSHYAIWIILAVAFFHIYGMYVMQMKDQGGKTQGIARVLWISAWICLIAVIVIILYLVLRKE